MRRQIFFVRMGGHDTHGDQPVAHAGLVGTTSRQACNALVTGL